MQRRHTFNPLRSARKVVQHRADSRGKREPKTQFRASILSVQSASLQQPAWSHATAQAAMAAPAQTIETTVGRKLELGAAGR